MTSTDFLIVGQGIAGIIITFELLSKGKKVIVVDGENPSSASFTAAALLNPINLNTGRAFPNEQTDIQTALDTYQRLERFLGVGFVEALPLIQLNFKPSKIHNHFLKPCPTQVSQVLDACFRHFKTALFLERVHHVRFKSLKTAWKNELVKQGNWLSGKFDYNDCKPEGNDIRYRNIIAKHLLFCEGAAGRNNPFFSNLPFNKNMGNVLVLHIPTLPAGFCYHFQGKKLVPLGQQLFWFGSNYSWHFDCAKPDASWLLEQKSFLGNHLKLSFSVVQHSAAERPTTAGQKPLLLTHEKFPTLHFFNGLGTRGFSLAPALAQQMIQTISDEE